MTTTTKARSLIVSPGTNPDTGRLFITIGIRPRNGEPELSITGVEGPKANGDCRGSSGQCVGALQRVTKFAPGWDAAKCEELRKLWERWHLNAMRAGCEHQRAASLNLVELTLYHYRLNSDTLAAREALKRNSLKALQDEGRAEASDDARRLLGLPYSVVNDGDADNGLCPTEYELQKTEKKLAGWVYPKDHPEGQLTRPCPECGYKYGSKWLYEALPDDVLEWLFSLPASDAMPDRWAR